MLTVLTLAILLQTASGDIPAFTPDPVPVAQPEAQPQAQPEAQPALPPPTGPTSVTSIVRGDAITPDLAAKLEAEVRKALLAAGLDVQPAERTRSLMGTRDALSCAANMACYSLLATLNLTPVMVVVEASSVQQDLAVVLQAIDATGGKVVAEESLVTPAAALDTGITAQLQPFSKKVRDASITAAPIVVADAPVQPKLVPEEKPIVVAPAPPPEKSRVPAIVTGVGAVAAAAVAIIFAAKAVSAQSCLNGPPVDGRPTVCVSQDRAPGLRGEINRDYAIGGGSAAVAAALAIVTSRLWSAE